MTDTITDLLNKRTEIKRKKPTFLRTDAGIIKRIPKKWRRPRGRDNKLRRRLRGSLASPSYSSPKKVRGMHPKGLFEILVSNVGDLKNIDNKKQIIRIRGTVGNKKKRDIIKKAKELKLQIINPKIRLKTKIESKEKKKPEPKKEKKAEETKPEEHPKEKDTKKEEKTHSKLKEPKKEKKVPPKKTTSKPKTTKEAHKKKK